MVRIADGVHRIGSGLVNAYLVSDGGGVTVVDAGMPGYWKDLRTELRPQGLEIVTVALDARGIETAGPWIEKAAAEHPSLIDEAKKRRSRHGDSFCDPGSR